MELLLVRCSNTSPKINVWHSRIYFHRIIYYNYVKFFAYYQIADIKESRDIRKGAVLDCTEKCKENIKAQYCHSRSKRHGGK